MKNKKKIISKRMDLIKKLVLAVFVLLFAFLVFNSISNILKSKSKVDDKKDVEKYLSSHYSYDEFTIGERKDYKVHRLVAMAFIPNILNLPVINHKDENKSNNIVSNLEWCTPKYNSNYGTANQRRSEKQRCRMRRFLKV